MKVFAYTSHTNYGTTIHIVRAVTREDAGNVVKGLVWPDADVGVLDMEEEGVIFVATLSGG